MKNILYIAFVIIGFPLAMSGQTNTLNYVKTTDYRLETLNGTTTTTGAALVDDNKIEAISYYDGLGRPIQSISARAGGNREDIVSHTVYNEYSMSPKQFLPWANSGASSLDYIAAGTLESNITTFYDTEKYEFTDNPFSETVYELSPRLRPVEQAAPGEDWKLANGHTVKSEYSVNEAADNVYLFNVTLSGNTPDLELGFANVYVPGLLTKSIVKDENWTTGDDHTTQQFTNKTGQVLLKRTFDQGLKHDTYYIYDDFGNLSFVLSPEASDQIISNNLLVTGYQQVLDDLGYQYRYDYRNRLIEKKIPGKGWEYIVYNLLDQPILTQDANLQANDQWLFTTYDVLGRVIYTGKVSSVKNRSGLQTDANAVQNPYEARSATTNTIAGVSVYYTDLKFPNTIVSQVLTVNYYDDYVDTADAGLPPAVTSLGTTLTTNTLGMPTVSKVKVMDGGNAWESWVTTVTGYDTRKRGIYTASANTYLNKIDKAETLLDFTGNVLESVATHSNIGVNPETITIRDYFSYDHAGRVLAQEQKIDDEPVQLIAKNTYDELGQLTKKDVGGETVIDGYTGIVNADVTAGNVIEKTSGTNAWDSGAKTRGEILENGGLRYTIESEAEFRIGLLKNSSADVGWNVFDYGIEHSVIPGPGGGTKYVKVIIDGVLDNTDRDDFVPGDEFTIERIDDRVSFKRNGNEFYSENNLDTASQEVELTGKVGLYASGADVKDMELFGPTIDKVLQEVDYAYNVRGWLTDINDVAYAGHKSPDLFNFRIHYNTLEVGTTGTKLYNGNISQTIWKTANTNINARAYGYSYDAINRIKGATSYKGATNGTLVLAPGHDLSNIAYDKNGNLTTLDRRGNNDTGSSYDWWDKLVYTYNGNQLQGVVDNSTGTLTDKGFKDDTAGSNADFSYDANGNMTIDNNKGITSMTYNHLNLPTSVIFGTTGQIDYIYDATGMKQKKVVTENGNTNTTIYAGGFMYLNNEMEFFPHAEGYVEPVAQTSGSVKGSSGGVTTYSSFKYVFQYKDHLGNVRLSYADNDLNGSISTSEIIEESNYYPFGLKQKGYNNTISGGNDLAQKWKYNGIEYNQDLSLNLYEMAFRSYDPAIGRFNGIDPVTHYSMGTSVAFDNNPVFWADPSGANSSTGPLALRQYNKTGNADALGTGLFASGTFDFMKPKPSGGAQSGSNTSPGSSSNTTGSPPTDYKRKFGQMRSEFKQANSQGLSLKEHGSILSPASRMVSTTGIVLGAHGLGRLSRGLYKTTGREIKALYYPNGQVRSARAASFVTQIKLVRFLSNSAAITGIGIDVIGLDNYLNDPTSEFAISPTKFALNTGMTLYSSLGGRWGWGVSTAYFYADFMNTWATPRVQRSIQKSLEEGLSPEEMKRRHSCFVPGTKIIMHDGTTRNIEDVKVGDVILSVNIKNMKVGPDIVVDIPEATKRYRMIEASFENGTINKFSPAHPYWVKGKGWSVFDIEEARKELNFSVDKLEVGDVVLFYENGKLLETKVKSLLDTKEYVEMYNLEYVKENHTFFANGILVHNKLE